MKSIAGEWIENPDALTEELPSSIASETRI
jgi:hypothetical protein